MGLRGILGRRPLAEGSPPRLFFTSLEGRRWRAGGSTGSAALGSSGASLKMRKQPGQGRRTRGRDGCLGPS